MTHETDNNPSTPDKLKSGWVWRCTDGSIAAGQISILAIFETVVAVGVYWWLALQFEWLWLAFVSMIAAPLLLLRSEKSIALGIKLLRAYWVPGYQKNISHREKISTVLTIATVTALLSYWLISYGFTNYTGWSLLWCAVTLIIGAFVIAFTITIVILGPGAMMGTKTVNSVIFKIFFNDIFLPFVALGLVIRGLFIRLYATLRYPFAGLAQLPQNWRETLLVIDFLHLPELLPQASTVDPAFGVKEAWVMQQRFNRLNRLIGSVHIFILYIPALIYRWSLKASAWLWFPLALALTPPLHQKKVQDSRRWMAVLHAWHWSYWIIATVGILWLLSATPWLETWLPLLPIPTEYATIHANLPAPPTFGLRYILACLGCLLILALIVKSKNLKASHGKVFDSPDDFDSLSPENKNNFLSIAKSIDRTRLLLIAILVLWGEMMALGFLHAHYPDVVERFISPALLLYL